jgi:hypothetical protein
MILLVAPKTIQFLSKKKARAMALFPFILVSNKIVDDFIIRHEKIHIRQQLELLVFPFYLWYGVEFLVLLIKYRDAHLAYLNISFEKEAYENHFDKNYLKERKLFSFCKYL